MCLQNFFVNPFIYIYIYTTYRWWHAHWRWRDPRLWGCMCSCQNPTVVLWRCEVVTSAGLSTQYQYELVAVAERRPSFLWEPGAAEWSQHLGTRTQSLGREGPGLSRTSVSQNCLSSRRGQLVPLSWPSPLKTQKHRPSEQCILSWGSYNVCFCLHLGPSL